MRDELGLCIRARRYFVHNGSWRFPRRRFPYLDDRVLGQTQEELLEQLKLLGLPLIPIVLVPRRARSHLQIPHRVSCSRT